MALKNADDVESGDDVRISTTTGTYRATVDGDPYRKSRDETPGRLRIDLEVDGDHVDPDGDGLPSQVATIHAKSYHTRDEWKTADMTVWKPVHADDDPSLIVDDEYLDLGAVEDVERLEDELDSEETP